MAPNLKDLIEEGLKNSSQGGAKSVNFNAEAHHLENEKKKLILREEAFRLKHLQEEHSQRIHLIRDIFAFTMVWLMIVVIILLGVGMNNLELSDSIIITLITTSTAEVLGFFGIVLRYLYNHNNQPKFRNNGE